MAITATSKLNNFSDTDQSTDYVTASATPGAGTAWLLFVNGTRGSSADPPVASVTGMGLTWTSLGSILWATDTATHRRAQMFSGVGSASAGALTISYAGTAMTGCSWSLIELAGGNATTPIVPGSVVTGFSNTIGKTATLTFNAAALTANRPIGFYCHGTSEATTFRTNWTEIGDVAPTSPGMGIETQWRSDAFETTGTATWATDSRWGAIGGEIAILATVYTDTQSGTVNSSGSAADAKVAADTAGITVTSSGTATDAKVGVDSGGVTLTTSGTSTESDSQAASGAGTIGLNGYVTEAALYADVASGTVSASGSADEAYTPGGTTPPPVVTPGVLGGNKFMRKPRPGRQRVPLPVPVPPRPRLFVDKAQGWMYLTGTGEDAATHTDAGSGSFRIEGRTAGEGWNIPLPTDDPRVGMLEALLADMESEAKAANDRAVLLEAELVAGKEETRLLTVEADVAHERAATLDARVQALTSRLNTERLEARQRLAGEHEVVDALMLHTTRLTQMRAAETSQGTLPAQIDAEFARLLEDVLIACEA